MRVPILSMSYLLRNEIERGDDFANGLVRRGIALNRSWNDNIKDLLQFVMLIEERDRLSGIIGHETGAAFVALKRSASTQDSTDFYYERLRQLYKYFYALDLFFQELQSEDKESFIDFLSDRLIADFPGSDYIDPELFLNKLRDYTGLTVKNVLTRMQTFTNVMLAKICHQFDAGHISYNSSPEGFAIEKQGEIGEVIYNRAKILIENLLAAHHVTLRVGRRRLPSTVSASELSVALTPTPLPAEEPLPQQLSRLNLWRRLSTKQKWLFGGLIALEVIGIVAAAIFAPASALVTVKGAMILNAKILTLLAGAAVLAGSAVAVDRRRRQGTAMKSDLFELYRSPPKMQDLGERYSGSDGGARSKSALATRGR